MNTSEGERRPAEVEIPRRTWGARSRHVPAGERRLKASSCEASHMQGFRESRRPDSNRGTPFITSLILKDLFGLLQPDTRSLKQLPGDHFCRVGDTVRDTKCPTAHTMTETSYPNSCRRAGVLPAVVDSSGRVGLSVAEGIVPGLGDLGRGAEFSPLCGRW
jgi:hypothetical protein